MTSKSTSGARAIPLHDITEPVVCTIDRSEIGDHLARLERLRPAVQTVTRTETGVIVCFENSEGVAEDLTGFVQTESNCCKFWGFETWTDNDLSLRWDGPPVTAGFMDLLVGYLAGNGSIGSLFAAVTTKPGQKGPQPDAGG